MQPIEGLLPKLFSNWNAFSACSIQRFFKKHSEGRALCCAMDMVAVCFHILSVTKRNQHMKLFIFQTIDIRQSKDKLPISISSVMYRQYFLKLIDQLYLSGVRWTLFCWIVVKQLILLMYKWVAMNYKTTTAKKAINCHISSKTLGKDDKYYLTELNLTFFQINWYWYFTCKSITSLFS